jgi:hypothetical protein
MAAPAIAAGRLVRKQVDEESLKHLHVARPASARRRQGLKWWLEKLEDPASGKQSFRLTRTRVVDPRSGPSQCYPHEPGP